MGGKRVAATAVSLALLAVAACAAPRKLGNGSVCELNSECAAPLVCRLGACRNECVSDRDCTGGASCVRDTQGLGICQVAAELHCALDSECGAPLVCRAMRCVNVCATDRDCPPGNLCMDVAGGRGCIDSATETSCVRDSDCAPPARCATDGRCRPECLTDRDCRLGTVCLSSQCLRPGTDAGARDSGTTDGGGTDGGGCPATSTPTSLAVGLDFACASVVGGDVYCWGRNGPGLLGVDPASLTESQTPLRVSLTGVAQVFAAGDHACALGLTGALSCWGGNAHGELGDGTTTPRFVPVTPVGLGGLVSKVGVGITNVCAIEPAGLRCWGEQSYGALGDGMTGFVAAPVTTPTLVPGASAGDVAVWTHGACFLDGTSTAVCFGRNDALQVGSGIPTMPVGTPTPVPGVTTRSRIWAGPSNVCVSGPGGIPTCWGANAFGELGDGSMSATRGPGDVLGTPVGVVAPGEGFLCAVSGGARALCWGRNDQGQLGDGTFVDRSTPGGVALPVGVTAIAAGTNGGCAITADRSVWCWGGNASGILGLGQPVGTGSSTPVRIECLP